MQPSIGPGEPESIAVIGSSIGELLPEALVERG
jgi:hypothetical protein